MMFTYPHKCLKLLSVWVPYALTLHISFHLISAMKLLNMYQMMSRVIMQMRKQTQ